MMLSFNVIKKAFSMLCYVNVARIKYYKVVVLFCELLIMQYAFVKNF